MSRKAPKRAAIGKVILINAIVLFVLISLSYWAIPFFGSLSRLYKTSVAETWFRTVPASYRPDEAPWVKQHWMELNRLVSVYKSYVGWRQGQMHGGTITVEGRYLQRRTVNAAAPNARKVYFFGGSAMWGIGSRDAETIPSQFATLTGSQTENFGEHGWFAHQNLMQLIQLLQAGHRPDVVIFYDGVNDALEKCRSELPHADSHQHERSFDRVLRASTRPDSYAHFFAPVLMVANQINDKLGLADVPVWYDCHQNASKANEVADSMIEDWQWAKRIVNEHGGTFFGMLQPVSFMSRTPLDYLRLSSLAKVQYHAVYPLMRQKIADGGEFNDLVPVLDRDEPIYIDWCHLTPKGNHYVAERIAEIVGK